MWVAREAATSIRTFQVSQQHAADIERRLASKIAEVEQLSEQLSLANAQLGSVLARAQDLELALAQSNAKVEAQTQIGKQLEAYFDKNAGSSSEQPR